MSAKPKAKPKPKPAAKAARTGPALLRKLALALPETTEEPHFESTSYRVRRKIFATYGEQGDRAVLKLSPELQEAMIAAHPKVFEPVAGYWGRNGWTRMDIANSTRVLLSDVLTSAWAGVAPKKLVAAHAEKLRKA